MCTIIRYMGRIIPYKDIESGNIPTSQDFQSAVDVFRDFSEDNIEQGNFDGSFIFGSVASGTPGIRSDFDSVVVFRTGEKHEYQAAQDMSQTIKKETGYRIPIEVMVRTRESMADGRHDFDRFFGQHLTSPHRIVHGIDVAEYITYPGQEISAKDILAGYLFHKKRRLSVSYISNEPLSLRDNGIQRMLELPIALGRKTLQAMDEHHLADPAPENSADKRLIIDRSRDLFMAYDTVDGFDQLIGLNRDYEQLLAEAIAGDIRQPEYESTVGKLHGHLPDAIKWIEQVEKSILPAFDTVLNSKNR